VADPHLGYDDQLWAIGGQGGDRQQLIQAIDHSLRYLATPAAAAAYANYPVPGITLSRVRRSLQRFQELLLTVRSPQELQVAVRREFEWYQSIGADGLGSVEFTGYFEPTYSASRLPTDRYRYPLYRRPPNLASWPQPHPTREQLEGIDGLQGSSGALRGLELVWLGDRLEAFLVHVQGSARLQMTDGSIMTVGYDGRTDYPYTSLGRELVNDGKLAEANLTLPAVLNYFLDQPDALNTYLPRNDRFIFFRETAGAPPTGSLSVPVTSERSIATDKSLMPPGALALIDAELPFSTSAGLVSRQEAEPIEFRRVSRFVLDQDTGGAIRGAGRVDIFMGSGTVAGDRAGLIRSRGNLYYLLIRNPHE
jgi:membrane-bound lytic murein transglycosylase A